jgi:parvulin-like peptidyl-prolyl isomerase
MKLAVSAAALLMVAPAAYAQTAPAQTAPATTAPAATTAVAAAKFNLDTPIETIAADEKAKSAFEGALPGIFAHPSYEMFKGMSLRQVQPYSNGQLTDEMLKKAEEALAAVK